MSINIFSSKIIATAIGSLMVAGATTTIATPAQADLTIRIGNGIQFVDSRNHCGYVRRVSARVVHYRARQAGFYRIRNTHLVRYNNRYGYRNCGIYKSYAKRYGRNYTIYSSARTGRVLHTRYAGYVAPTPTYRPVLSAYQVRQRLHFQGYRFVRNMRLHRSYMQPASNFGYRSYRHYYTATATRFGRRYKLYVSARNGRVLRRSIIRYYY